MLKIYRKIRQKLLNEGKLKRYMIYALGEILLVIIGILIALKINNSNINNQNEKNFDAIYIEILNDLEADIKGATPIIEFYKEQDLVFNKILNNKITHEDYENGLGPVISNYDFMTFNTAGYNQLSRKIDLIPSKYLTTIKNLNALYIDMKTSVEYFNKEMHQIAAENIKEFADNHPWYFKLNINRKVPKEAYYFFLNDPHYKNKVAVFRIYMIGNHLPGIMEYKYLATKCYKDIFKILYGDKDLPEFIIENQESLKGNDLNKFDGKFEAEDGDSFDIIIHDNALYAVFGSDSIELKSHSKTIFHSLLDNSEFHFMGKDSLLITSYYGEYRYYRNESDNNKSKESTNH